MTKPFIAGACATLLACATGAAHAAVTLPSGDAFLDGTLEFFYADNGSARIDPALYVDSNELFAPGGGPKSPKAPPWKSGRNVRANSKSRVGIWWPRCVKSSRAKMRGRADAAKSIDPRPRCRVARTF